MSSHEHWIRSAHLGKRRKLAEGREYEFVTFDCYGTLIDWETGIRTAFNQLLKGFALDPSQEIKLLELYQEEEKRIEGLRRYRKYREVVAMAASEATKRFGKNIPERASSLLAEQLPTWDPFPDTNPALQRLAKKRKLGILSNVDDDLLAGTLRHFTVPFDLVVTAERVKSYKPGTKHFEEARRIIGAETSWLHVAASLYHDIEPASRLGIKTVWVNRKNSDEERRPDRRIVREVRDLTQLANWLVP